MENEKKDYTLLMVVPAYPTYTLLGYIHDNEFYEFEDKYLDMLNLATKAERHSGTLTKEKVIEVMGMLTKRKYSDLKIVQMSGDEPCEFFR